MRILTIGELLWDIIDHSEHLGGAPLNFSAAVQQLGNPATLVSGVGDDSRGGKALELMAELNLSTKFVRVLPGKDTGTALVSKDSTGSATFFIKRPAAFDEYQVNEDLLLAIEDLHPHWIYFGTLTQTHPPSFTALTSILQRLPDIKRFYDMNLREGHWNLSLVQRLSKEATILKLNEDEAQILFALTRPCETFSLEDFSRYWSKTYDIDTICITLGSKGCAVFHGDALHIIPGFPVTVVDTVGAGDAFAAAFLHGCIMDWPISYRATFANALGALVASRAGAIPAWTVDECQQMIAGQDLLSALPEHNLNES